MTENILANGEADKQAYYGDQVKELAAERQKRVKDETILTFAARDGQGTIDGLRDALQIAQEEGRKYLFNKQQTGSGKSYAIEPVFGSKRFIYSSNDIYNPANEYLAGIVKLPSRYNYSYYDNSKLNSAGKPTMRVTLMSQAEGLARSGDQWEEETKVGNCIRASEANAAAMRGVDTDVCDSCPEFSSCISGKKIWDGARSGEIGYIASRREAMKAPQIRAHTTQLERIALKELREGGGDFFSGRILILDDVSPLQINQVKVRIGVLRRQIRQLEESGKGGDVFLRFLKALVECLAKVERTKFGISYHQLTKEIDKQWAELHQLVNENKELIKELESMAFFESIALKQPIPEEWPEDMSREQWQEKAKLDKADRDRKEAGYLEGEVGNIFSMLLRFPNANISFEKVYIGNRIVGECVVSAMDRTAWKYIFEQCERVVILDATLNLKAFYSALGIEEKECILISSEPRDNKNLQIQSITGLGRLRKTSKEDVIDDAVRYTLWLAKCEGKGKVGLIISTSMLSDKQRTELMSAGVIRGTPHAESRGSNSFKECKHLVNAVSYLQNRNSLAVEYQAYFGDLIDPADYQGQGDGWEEYTKAKQAAEVVQSIGRLRHTQRPSETLTVHQLGFLADDVWDLIEKEIPGATRKGSSIKDDISYKIKPKENNKLVLMSTFRTIKKLYGKDVKVTRDPQIKDLLSKSYMSKNFRKMEEEMAAYWGVELPEVDAKTLAEWEKETPEDGWRNFLAELDACREGGITKGGRSREQVIADFFKLVEREESGEELKLSDVLETATPKAWERTVDPPRRKGHEQYKTNALRIEAITQSVAESNKIALLQEMLELVTRIRLLKKNNPQTGWQKLQEKLDKLMREAAEIGISAKRPPPSN